MGKWATIVNIAPERPIMKLTFLGKDSTPNDSPTLYATDRDTYLVQGLSGDGVVQGYELTRDPALVARCVAAFEAAWRAAIPHSEYARC